MSSAKRRWLSQLATGRGDPRVDSGCPADVARWAAGRRRRQYTTPHGEPSSLVAWPEVPCSYVLARQDGVVGVDWARRAARDRLDVVADEIDGGHSPFLSRPAELAEMLDDIARSP